MFPDNSYTKASTFAIDNLCFEAPQKASNQLHLQLVKGQQTLNRSNFQRYLPKSNA